MIINLLKLEPSRVSKDLRDNSMLIFGASGIGKTPLALDIYGKERTLLLAFENSANGIAGAYTVNVDSYATLTAYLGQLMNPAMREKFDTIVIDTLFLLDYYCEKSVTDAYGVDLVKDALKWNAGYKIIDKRFLNVIKQLQKMNYTLCYIAHPIEKKVKDASGAEYIRIEPKVSDRIKNLLLPEVDIRLFCAYGQDGERVIYSQSTPYFDARCRGGELPPVLPFDANVLKDEFAKGIDRIGKNNNGLIVEKKENVLVEDKSFEEVMAYIMELGKKAQEQNKFDDANTILSQELGCDDDGNQRGLDKATPQMMGALNTIVVRLEQLLG
jgi:phage nucleotide-binding protein